MIVSNYQKTQGATLVVSLVILLLLTLLATATMRTTLMEEKISSNMQDKEHSFQAAESALIEAENWLMGLSSEPIPQSSCSSQPCVTELNPSFFPESQDASWWSSNGAAYTSGAISNVQSTPLFFIEFARFVADSPVVGKGAVTGTYYYRITTRGTGASDEAVTVLQTTVAQRF